MSSMSKVMQKIQEGATQPPETETPAPEPQAAQQPENTAASETDTAQNVETASAEDVSESRFQPESEQTEAVEAVTAEPATADPFPDDDVQDVEAEPDSAAELDAQADGTLDTQTDGTLDTHDDGTLDAPDTSAGAALAEPEEAADTMQDTSAETEPDVLPEAEAPAPAPDVDTAMEAEPLAGAELADELVSEVDMEPESDLAPESDLVADAELDSTFNAEPVAASPAQERRASSGLFASGGMGSETEEAPAPSFDERTAEWKSERVDPVIVTFHDRYSAICEQYRSVRARLMTMNTSNAQQVIAVTSSIPEEGKSVSTINLGLVMAEGGEHRILIADADFRRTSVARMLGIRSKPGLADVLRGEISLEEAIQHTPFPNLKVVPAGEVRNNAYADLLGSPSTIAKLDELRASFDYTFVDTPPITTVSDVCLLAPHCDGALMVIEMRRTPEPTVQQAVRTLQANNVKLLGCLLSRFRDRGSGYYEHYYSSYYSH